MLDPDDDFTAAAGLVTAAGLDVVPVDLRVVLAERLRVLPMLMPPLIVPPDVLSVGLDEPPDDILPVVRVLSVFARRVLLRGSKCPPPI